MGPGTHALWDGPTIRGRPGPILLRSGPSLLGALLSAPGLSPYSGARHLTAPPRASQTSTEGFSVQATSLASTASPTSTRLTVLRPCRSSGSSSVARRCHELPRSRPQHASSPQGFTPPSTPPQLWPRMRNSLHYSALGATGQPHHQGPAAAGPLRGTPLLAPVPAQPLWPLCRTVSRRLLSRSAAVLTELTPQP
ncbi:hypothetical protein NDU88_006809 [Pleurodeles waltl]|uniref:Uncharacterized protein n=1 Tax=Pleurodeles waltl TaxID=8319 RepID=A0AAV7VMX8_PLEWA|nr:hypothetical protein NDU88_006809 [Pleurodeles waltl]